MQTPKIGSEVRAGKGKKMGNDDFPAKFYSVLNRYRAVIVRCNGENRENLTITVRNPMA